MAYFTDFQDYFFLCSDISPEEKRKLNDYLRILEDSGVGEIIAEAVDKAPEKGGRPSYNPYRLFAAMLYAFSKHSGSLRLNSACEDSASKKGGRLPTPWETSSRNQSLFRSVLNLS